MAGSLKKKHKAFKSRHATKGQIKDANKGRVDSAGGSGKEKHTLSKNERRNHSAQMMHQKRIQHTQKLKMFNGKNGCARNICIVPLSSDVDSVAFVHKFQQALDGQQTNVPGQIFVPRFKQNLRFFVPQYNNFWQVLDNARAADFCLFLLSSTTEIDDYGEQLMRCISSQGCTTSVASVWGDADKKIKLNLSAWFGHFFAESRLFDQNEFVTLANTFCSKVPAGITWRDERPWVVAESVQVQPEGVIVEGVVRGDKLSCDQLVHIPGVGDCSISRIVGEQTFEPLSPESLDEFGDETEMHAFEQDDLVAQAGVRMEGHEYVTEMIDAEEDVVQTIKKVPKGMSEYQASWLIEGEDYGLENENPEDAAGDLSDEEGELVPNKPIGVQDESMEDEGANSDAEDFSGYEPRANDAKDDLEFPDEIDYDPSVSRKDKLADYRGVRDLGHVEWDGQELDKNTPSEWSRLVRPGNLFATKNRLLKQEREGAQVGERVAIYLPVTDAMRRNEEAFKASVFVLYGLLPLEHKIGQVNMSITPDSEFDESIPSQAPLLVQYGPRRVRIEPTFSTPGSRNSNNVYKMFRYLHPGHPATASFIGNVLLSQAPTVYYTLEGRLVGTGNVMDCDAHRIIVKRAVLTGVPFKINKKIVTIRYMFFNSDDVQWFKSVPLYTKNGCSGFIKESLGTHGYFKATFDRKINAQDVVCLALYRRSWPKRAQQDTV